MKKCVLLIVLAVGYSLARADAFTYLNLTKADNSQVSLKADGLKITFADGNLVVENDGEKQSFSLGDITSFLFSDTKANGVDDISQTAVSAVGVQGAIKIVAPAGSHVEVFNLLGSKVLTTTLKADGATIVGNSLAQGVYVVRISSRTFKVLVK